MEGMTFILPCDEVIEQLPPLEYSLPLAGIIQGIHGDLADVEVLFDSTGKRVSPFIVRVLINQDAGRQIVI